MKACIALLIFATFVGVGSEVPTITVQVSGSVKVAPTALQLWLTVKDKGPDAAGALAALKADKEKLAGKLASLGVKTDQLKGDMPMIIDRGAGDSNRARRPGGGRLKRKPATEEKPEVEAQQMLHLLLPLTGKDPEAILAEAEGIKTKVHALKLIDEKADGGEEDDNDIPFPDGQKVERLLYVFYAPSSEELQSQAMADALKKANESAARAAKAMGKGAVELYALTINSESDTQTNAYQVFRNNYNEYGRQPEMPTPDEGIVSQTPQMMVYAQISAVFRFK